MFNPLVPFQRIGARPRGLPWRLSAVADLEARALLLGSLRWNGTRRSFSFGPPPEVLHHVCI